MQSPGDHPSSYHREQICHIITRLFPVLLLFFTILDFIGLKQYSYEMDFRTDCNH